MMITNPTGFTQKLVKGAIAGEASEAECIRADDNIVNEQLNEGVGGEVYSGGEPGCRRGGSGGERRRGKDT